MLIWTTRQFNELLLSKELPPRLFPASELKSAFLAQAAPGDIALIGIDDTYLEFLSAVKERGIEGPILFISAEPTMVEIDIRRYNALVLDLKKMGLVVVRNTVHAILDLASRRTGIPFPDFTADTGPDAKPEEKAIEDKASIRDRLNYIHKKEISVIVALEVRENNEPVTARGLCGIKEVREDAMVFHRFKQPALFKAIKIGASLKVYFTHKQENYGSLVVVRNMTDKEIVTSVPTNLFITREMRIQPNLNKPIGLYMLIANEPTTNFKVLDISQRGIGFLCPRDLPIDRAYSFTIVLPDPQTFIVTTGVIHFKKESSQGIRYGVEIRPHPWDAESLVKYIMKRETEIIGLLRNS